MIRQRNHEKEGNIRKINFNFEDQKFIKSTSRYVLIHKLFSRGGNDNRDKGESARLENTLTPSTHDHRDAHSWGPVVVPRCRNGGYAGCGAVARLCLTLPRTTPRLRVLILISPFKFLWHGQRAARRPTFHPAVHQELCSALATASGRETIHHRGGGIAIPPPRCSSAPRDRREDAPLVREARRARSMSRRVDGRFQRALIQRECIAAREHDSPRIHPFLFSPSFNLVFLDWEKGWRWKIPRINRVSRAACWSLRLYDDIYISFFACYK